MSLAFVSTSVYVLSHDSQNNAAVSTRSQFSPSSFVARRARVPLSSGQLAVNRTPRMAQGDASKPDGKPNAKELAKLYGGSYLGTSIGLSIVSYFVLYAMIAAGVDMRALVNAFGNLLAATPIGRPSVLDSISDTASTATLAYIAHKATSPLRFPLTVAATPVIARAFSKKEPNEATGGDA